MTRKQLIETLAEFYEIEPQEDGTYDLNSYEWVCGGFIGGNYSSQWLNLQTIVEALEPLCEED